MKKPISPETIPLFSIPILLIIAAIAFKGGKNQEPVVIDLSDFKPVSSFDQISWLAYSPDGKKLGLANNSLVRVYDATTNAKICDLATTPSSRKDPYLDNPRPAWSDDGRHIGALCSSWVFRRLKPGEYVNRGGKVYGFDRKDVRRFAVWDAQSGSLTSEVLYGQRRYSDTEYLHPQSLRFTAYDKRLFGEEAPRERFDADGERVKLPDGKLTKYEHLYYNEAVGQLAVMGEKGHSVQVIDTKNKKVLWKIEDTRIQSMKWAKNVLCVVTTYYGSNNKLLLWDGKTRKELPTPPVKFELIPANMYAPLGDDAMVFSVIKAKYSRTRQPYWHHELVAWDFRQNRMLWRTTTEHFMNRLQVSPDGKLISALAYNGFDAVGLHIFDATGRHRAEYGSSSEKYIWSPDNRHIAMLSEPEDSYRSDKFPQMVIYDVGE